MKGWTLILAAIVAATALLLASPFATAGEAGKMPLRIDWKTQGRQGATTGSGTFTLQGANAAYSDAGSVTYQFSFGATTKSRAGQFFTRNSGMNTFKGRHGGLVIRTSGQAFEAGGGGESGYEAWTGTWSIVRGTGKYAGLKGSGGYAAVVTPDLHFSFRYEGFVTGS